MTFLENITKPSENTCGHIGQILTLPHDVEVEVWNDFKDFEYLIKHFTMLTSYTHYGLENFWMFLEFLNQWTHLDGFGTSTED